MFHLDKQTVLNFCPECSANFTVVRGSAYDDGEGIGLYLIALHGHSPQSKLAHLAIALKVQGTSTATAEAAAMDVVPSFNQIGFSLVNWDLSPWCNETYLGRMLSPGEVRESAKRDEFFHVASHVVKDVEEVVDYFSG